MPCYFFSGNQYIRVSRNQLWPGTVDAGYPASISNWNWGSFGANGIDAALSSGPKDYFFSGNKYIRVTRGTTGPGSIDANYPAPISNWGWGSFGANGINAALASGTKAYFFSGNQYIRVSRADINPGKMDPGYPAPISNWGWGAFGANGIDAALNSGEVDYFFSGNQYIRVSRGETGPGAMDPGYPAPISNWGWKTFGANGIKAALWSGFDFTDAVAAPSGGLASSSNYILADSGNHLKNLTVTIDLYANLTYSANGAPMANSSSVSGFTCQLNCFSAKMETDAVQQYVIGYDGSEIYGQINNWKNATTSLINQAYNLVSSPVSKSIPAVYKVRIALENDSNDNVSGVAFSVFDQNGKTTGSKSVTLTSISGVSATDLAPIVAFEMDIVGPGNSESVTFSSGNGTVTYAATNQLTALSSVPSYVDADLVTQETSNASYGTLSGTASAYLQHSFNVNPSQQPLSVRVGKKRPPLRVPQNRK
jgi:Hemopexin